MKAAPVPTETECARILYCAEERVLQHLLAVGHATPSVVLGPIRITLMRLSAPFALIAAESRKAARSGVVGLDRETLIALFPLRRLTLGDARQRATLPLVRAALDTICDEIVVVARKRWALGELRTERLTAENVSAADSAMKPEFMRGALATPLSAILRARGQQVVPLRQELIMVTHHHLARYYETKPHLTATERASLHTDAATVRVHARYPGALLQDIADLVTGHCGYVLGRVDPNDVKSCLQRNLPAVQPGEP